MSLPWVVELSDDVIYPAHAQHVTACESFVHVNDSSNCRPNSIKKTLIQGINYDYVN